MYYTFLEQKGHFSRSKHRLQQVKTWFIGLMCSLFKVDPHLVVAVHNLKLFVLPQSTITHHNVNIGSLFPVNVIMFPWPSLRWALTTPWTTLSSPLPLLTVSLQLTCPRTDSTFVSPARPLIYRRLVAATWISLILLYLDRSCRERTRAAVV